MQTAGGRSQGESVHSHITQAVASALIIVLDGLVTVPRAAENCNGWIFFSFLIYFKVTDISSMCGDTDVVAPAVYKSSLRNIWLDE